MFLEGKGLLGGWDLLAEKLRFLGVTPSVFPMVGDTIRKESKEHAFAGARSGAHSFVEAVKSKKNPLRDVVQISVEEEEVSGRLGE